MKPANVLVFKDYRVKVGDLGVSIRLTNNQHQSYQLKGVTMGYVAENIIDAFKKGKKLSKTELFEAD